MYLNGGRTLLWGIIMDLSTVLVRHCGCVLAYKEDWDTNPFLEIDSLYVNLFSGIPRDTSWCD